MHQNNRIKFTMTKHQISVYFLTILPISTFLYFLGYEIILTEAWVAYLLIIFSFLLIMLLLYSIFFLFKYGLPYVEINAHLIQSKTFLKNKIIQIKSIEETGFILQKINRFTTLMDLVIYQKSNTQKIRLDGHQIRKEIKLPLSFLPQKSRFEVLNVLSIMYYTDESKRENLIREYNQTENFNFENYLDSRLLVLLNQFGVLTILPEHELQETLRLIEEDLSNTTILD